MTEPTHADTLHPDEPAAGPSRRGLLIGALGGAAAWALAGVARPADAQAADGDVVHVGDENLTGTKTTGIWSATPSISVIWGNATATTGTGVGVRGSTGAAGGTGVWGTGAAQGVGVVGQGGIGVRGGGYLGVQGIGTGPGSNGVRGDGEIGVYGESGAASGAGVAGWSPTTGGGVVGQSGGSTYPVPPPKTGVYGKATHDEASRGVWGESGSGQGVRGEASSGVGLYGAAASGYALRTSGRVRPDRISGVASIGAGKTSVTIAPGVNVTADSFVLLTAKANIGTRGLWFTTDAAANRITIRMTSSRSRSTPVAWLLLG